MSSVLEFDPSNLFDEATTAVAEGDQEGKPDVYQESVDPEADTVLTTLAEEDDGPQPGDDLDDEPEAEVVDQVDVATPMTSGITPAENTLVEIQNAELKCIRAEAEVDDLKEQLKEAKAHYDGCVDRLRKLCRAAQLDGDRPLLAAAEAVNAAEASRVDASDADGEMFDDEGIDAAIDEAQKPERKLAAGELRIRLLKEIVDEHPTRGTLTWPKGTKLVALVDSTGGTVIPFADDPTDGTGLEAEEFEVIEEPASESANTTEASDDDPRFATSLAETSIPAAIVAKLAEASPPILTVRDLATFTAKFRLTDIKGIGAGKAEKIEAAMVEFWAGK